MVKKTNREIKLSVRTLNTMIKQGIGHTNLKKVVENLKKSKK